MNNYSLIEKIGILMKLISSSSLFLVFSMLCIAFLIYFVICIIKNKKVNKVVLIIVFSIIGFILIINYGDTLLKLLDAIIDASFKALYFPNLPIYISVLLILNTSCIISLVNKNELKIKKIVNLICFVIFDFIFLLIINVVSKYNINIYEEINLYTNSTLLVLLELSTGIFTSWILIILFIKAHNKLKIYDRKEYPEIQEIIFD